jgi:hypothetical protein
MSRINHNVDMQLNAVGWQRNVMLLSSVMRTVYILGNTTGVMGAGRSSSKCFVRTFLVMLCHPVLQKMAFLVNIISNWQQLQL